MSAPRSAPDSINSAPRAPLREAHAHLVSFGQTMQRLDLSACVDVHDCLNKVAHAASELKVIHNFDDAHPARTNPSHRARASGNDASTTNTSTPWLIAWGLRPHAWPDPRWPTMHELDGACSDIPCFLAGFDHHSAVCNSLAFAAAGYNAHSPDPVGGTIVRDTNAQPTGLLLEAAYTRARDAIPQPTREQAKALLIAATSALADLGFVEAHDLYAQPWLGDVLAELDDQGLLPIRVGLFAPLEPSDAFASFDAFASRSREWQRPRVQFLGGKVFADGTLNSATAAMLHPYREPLPHFPLGQLLLETHDIANALRRVQHYSTSKSPLSLAVHAIGDRAVRTTLDAYEMIPQSSRPGLRVEHAELIDEKDVPRFRSLGAIASVQPCHLLYDIEVLERQFPDRLNRVLPLRELIDSGLVPGKSLLFGSDVPIVPADPNASIQAAVHRRRQSHPASRAIASAQAITELEAWACFSPTSNGSCS